MPTYISLVNLTEQGIKEVKNAPERLQQFDTAAREAGGKLIGFYLVMGQYDYIIIT
ncbi:MAG: GYD domain-containing protein, partial [Chloroflexi bacterium]